MQAHHQYLCTCGSHHHAFVGNATKRNVNPLRMDPSRTLQIQRQFVREIRRRFELFRIELVYWLVQKNSLNLTITRPKQGIRATRKHTVHLNARYDFQTSAEKIKSFRSWLKGQVSSGDLTALNAKGQPWTAEYIGSAYKKGLARAHMKELGVGRFSEKGSIAYKAAQDQFLRDSFAAPIRTDTLELLYTRTFNEMEGITDAMSTTLSRTLTDGLANGLGADEIARSMLDELDSLEETRAYRIARTEVARAQAEGQLDGFEALGVDELAMSVEFSTAGDEGVCPACRALANKHGGIYTVEQARGIIPVHPNCVLPDSLVESPDALALTRSKYFGPVIRVATELNSFSVTEHHVLLTKKGWRFAKDLKKGDELVSTAAVEGGFFVSPDKYNTVSPIGEAFEFASKARPELVGIIPRTSTENFHGDGASLDKEVDVVFADGLLWDKLQSNRLSEAKQFALVAGDVPTVNADLLEGASTAAQSLVALAAAADSIVGGLSIAPVLTRRAVSHHKPVGFSAPSDLHPRVGQSGPNHVPVAFEPGSECGLTFPAGVPSYKIIDVEVIEPASGGILVFDVWTHSSMYAINGVLSSNCRCAWIPSTRSDTRSDKKAVADTEGILERNEAYSSGGSRSRTSAKSYNPSTASKQAKARDNEKRIAKAVGGERTTGNAPFDVLVRGKYALEVKTMVDLRSNQITMRKECRERKLKWLASHKGCRAYTVVCDMRGSKTTFYIAKGVGSFRSSSLTKISLAQLAKMLS